MEVKGYNAGRIEVNGGVTLLTIFHTIVVDYVIWNFYIEMDY